jgi:hypothetical protein
MKFISLLAEHRGSFYSLERVTGSLICLPHPKKQSADFSLKLKFALSLCQNPYLLEKTTGSAFDDSNHANESRVARCFIRLSKMSFWAACRYASVGRPKWADAAEAIMAFRNQTADFDQNVLCLPRALFAARMSKKFAEKGVVLIGAFLPSRSLHAWILEDGLQPDPRDRQWINFQPVAAIH